MWFAWHMKTKWIKSAAAALALAAVSGLLTGCATVGETGRSQFIILSASEEMSLGLSSFEKMKKEMPISRDAAANAQVQRVGKRIAAVAQLPNAQWEFVVFESKEANAFCLPGGKIGVYSGILPITQSDAGLAAVMGHEVAHAYARHGAERVSEALGIQVAGQVLSGALSSQDPKVQTAAMTAYGLGATLGRELPHSRKQEEEADYIGLKYMARAGYDPEEAVKFWERFSDYNRKAAGGQTPWFLRTHPLDAKRIQKLKEWMPEAKAQYRPQ